MLTPGKFSFCILAFLYSLAFYVQLLNYMQMFLHVYNHVPFIYIPYSSQILMIILYVHWVRYYSHFIVFCSPCKHYIILVLQVKFNDHQQSISWYLSNNFGYLTSREIPKLRLSHTEYPGNYQRILGPS